MGNQKVYVNTYHIFINTNYTYIILIISVCCTSAARCAGLFEARACVTDFSNDRNSQYPYSDISIHFIIEKNKNNNKIPTTRSDRLFL